MAKLMGMHNRITEKRYNAAKVELKTPRDDKRVMKKYGFGESTARKIRNTDNYFEYRSKTTTEKRRREHLQTVLAELQDEPKYMEYEDSGIERILIFTIVIIALFLLVAGGIVFLILGGNK